jgi:ArsR family transcriptional regulator
MFTCSYVHIFERGEPMTAVKAKKREPAKLSERQDGAAIDTCSCNLIHEERVTAALAAAPDPGILAELGRLFKIFSDPTRLRILSALSNGELCVCDLGTVLGMSQSAVSHQLAVLRAARLVRHRREGKAVFYSLDDTHVGAILRVGMEHASERRIAG